MELKHKYNINIYRLPDYTKKGIYMSALIKKFGNNEFVFPILQLLPIYLHFKVLFILPGSGFAF